MIIAKTGSWTHSKTPPNTQKATTFFGSLPVQYCLKYSQGAEEDETFALDPECGAIIGRSPTNNVFFPDQSVSRMHCFIGMNPQTRRWYMEDLGSTNGSRLNNQKVIKAELQEGDVISVGNCQLRFARVAQVHRPARFVHQATA